MSLFKKKKSTASSNLSRREIVARRRQAVTDSSIGKSPRYYQKNRTISRNEEKDHESERQVWRDLKKRRRRLARWLLGSIGAILIIILIMNQLVASVSVQTKTIIPESDKSKYVAILNDYYKERPAERLRLFIKEEDLKAEFLTRAPEVLTAKVVPTSQLTEAGLKLTFREPVAQWRSGDKVYFVDGDGITFEKNYFKAPELVVNDKGNLQLSAGQEIFDHQFLGFLGQVVSNFAKNNHPVEEVILPEDSLKEVDIRVKDRPYLIKMSIDRSAQAQVQEALYAIDFFDNRNNPQEYVDVRVDRRAVYK